MAQMVQQTLWRNLKFWDFIHRHFNFRILQNYEKTLVTNLLNFLIRYTQRFRKCEDAGLSSRRDKRGGLHQTKDAVPTSKETKIAENERLYSASDRKAEDIRNFLIRARYFTEPDVRKKNL